MAIHRFSCKQFLPIPIEEAWEFFSSPDNLSRITPPSMDFVITSPDLPEKTYAGQIISYRVSPLPGFRTTWVTEITHVNAPHFFVDEQREGPYTLWHHQHHFEKTEGGVMMTDIVHYRIPLGIIGDLLNSLFIASKVKSIFDYRTKQLDGFFKK